MQKFVVAWFSVDWCPLGLGGLGRIGGFGSDPVAGSHFRLVRSLSARRPQRRVVTHP
jgi:hypothetical protein